MSCTALKVLLWKHFTVRIRRYIHSLVEFASPVVFFAILFSFKVVIIPRGSMPSIANITRVEGTDSYSLSDVKPPSRIFYHPDNNLAGLLIDDVGQKFRMQRLPNLVGPHQFANGYYGFSNESELETAFLQPDDAVVLFHNLDDSEWPESLNYTIRMKKFFSTHLIEAMDGLHPHEGFGTIYESFMRVQWAVDTSYIYLRTGHKIEQNVTLQEFPFYRRMEHQTIKVVCQILTVMCYLSLMLVFVFLVCRLLEERSTGIQELTKMVGVSSNMLGISHFLNALPGGLLYAVVGSTLVKVTADPFIPNTNWLYIFLILILHFVSIASMAFACSYLAKGTQYSITIALFSYAALGAPTTMLPKEMPRLLALLTGLLPHQPMIWFWTEVSANEEYGDGLSLSSLVSAHTPNSGCVLLCYFMLLVQSAICFSLAWYLNLVRPGKYGQALPWGFLFQRHYWSKNEVIPDDLSEVELINNGSSMSTEDIKYFEKPSRNLEVGIKISNVTKIFPKHKALDDVSLDVYKDEITVLLGHNGAGKTTLMSIITGMVGATRGSVYVNGRNNVSERDEVRRHLGLCPQHNLFFSDLTVLEHVMFFTLLKGTTFRKARKSSQALLKQLDLSGKEQSRSADLSGGMKRRLQLACALAGDADVLVLDEPTSGLDVETRRGLWDLLLGLRGSRTVLVSTHFMEEAEALGDRVAALHCGRLCCHASPMHLKRALGTGYRLSLTTDGAPQEPKITKVVVSHVPTAEVKDQTINSLTYSLPAADSKKFHGLFTAIEDRRLELSINSIGVGISTLEEVFLKLCSDTSTVWGSEEKNGTTEESDASQYPKYTGMRLFTRQLWILLLRQMRFVISRKWSFITLQLVVPIALIWGTTYVFNNEIGDTNSNPNIALDLDLYKYKLERRVLYNATDISALQRMYPKVVFEPTSDVVEAVLRYAKKDIWEYNKYLIGLEVNDTDAKVLFTTVVRHAAPTALSALANLLAARDLPGAAALATSVWPLQGAWQLRQHHYREPKIRELLFFWVLCTIFIILATNINVVSLSCRERVCGARRVLALCGCAPALHWFSTLLFHSLVCLLGLLAPLLVIASTVDTDHTIDQPDFLMSFLLLMLLGCLAFFAFMYLVSFRFEERGAGAFLAGYTIVFGFVTSLIQITSELLSEAPSSFAGLLLDACWLLAPPHTLVLGAARAAQVARLNAFCTLNRDRCPALVFDTGFDATACCAGMNPRCYMCIDDYAPGKEMIILTCQFVVFMSLVLACECGWAARAWERVVNARYSAAVPGAAHADDPGAASHVRTAQLYVAKEIDLPDNKQTDAMLVHNVHKNYFKMIGKSCNAVKGVSFVVKKGECFGLLGVNGAGKSSIFKMLTAEEVPTSGRIFANGFHLERNRTQYLRTLGYCPQFHGLDNFLTGQQNLELLLTMRGLNAYDAEKEASTWLHTLGLEKLRHRALRAYSGGSARRLCAGAALAAGGALALLDEPTAGVDVGARRRLWAGVARAQRAGRSLVLSSHSMDETEALCHQIAIMAGGRIRALGSAPELRAQHAAGHAVLLQLRRDHSQAQEGQHDEVDSTKYRINNLKAALYGAFVGTIKDEHKTTIRFHISDPMRYSDLFDKLEQLKQQFQDLLEDYSVTETTLEEVFLSFAKESQN